jgi:GntR family transcriptional regulator, transcriptional repressor for pyruvate dehydrogenase complex
MPIIENVRLSKTVADDLQQKSISSELKVGDRLPTEPKLMEEYGVSRTVIREAAACLVSRGVVDVRPRRGMTVRAPDGKGLSDSLIAQLRMSNVSLSQLLQVRSVLETAMAGLAATQRTDADIVRLRDNLQKMESAGPDRRNVVKIDLEFHDLLAEATHNPFFILVSRPITELLYSIYINKSEYMTFRPTTYAEHRAIVDAIVDRDAEAAVTAIEKHLDRVGTTIEKLMADNQEIQPEKTINHR